MPNRQRASGVLLHITSLPSSFGIGDLGPESYRFVDLLAAHKQRYWSILPLSPTRFEDGNSPYQTSSAFAGNPLLISPELLVEDGLLPKQNQKPSEKPSDSVDFRFVYELKEALIKIAYPGFKKSRLQASEFEAFCGQNKQWLDDYALYFVLRQKTGKPWHEWLPSLRHREPKTLARKQQLCATEIEQTKFTQYLFFSQWRRLKEHCKKRGIKIIGDIPFYVAHDSADTWMYPELFSLHGNGKARYIGGVPPDYFSATGQLWGNPVYNWEKHKETGFEWWMNRIHHNLMLCDYVAAGSFPRFCSILAGVCFS